MAQHDGVAAGWRLFSTWAQTALPTRLRRSTVMAGVTVSIIASAGADLLFGHVRLFAGAGGGEFVLLALAAFFAGSGIGSIAAVVVFVARRRRLLRDRRRAEETSTAPKASRWRFRPSGVPVGDAARIRAAWLEGREPDVPLPQRLAAAQSARGARVALPAVVLSSLVAVPFWVSGAGFVLTILFSGVDSDFVGFIAPAYLVIFGGQALPYLRALGRTTAPIETAPAVPDHLHPDGRKRPVPHKPLGTDHPDDYR